MLDFPPPPRPPPRGAISFFPPCFGWCLQERCAGAPPSNTPLGPDTAAVDQHHRHHGHNQLPPQLQQQQQPSKKKEEAAGDGRGGFGRRFEADVGYVDVDTRVSRESYGAARTAAGAVILAVRLCTTAPHFTDTTRAISELFLLSLVPLFRSH